MQDFSGLPETLSVALSKKGYTGLTPVQQAVSDPGLAGKDLLVSAQTGSGKTVGFGLAMANDLLDAQGRFDRPAAPLAVVIAPTRELALQVRREFDWLFAEAGIVTASAVGGMDTRTERRALERGAHVVVATPGRLRDHTASGAIDLSGLQVLVLDEADEMLDMGFAEDLEFIVERTPETRRTLMFSATVPHGIAKLAQTFQKEDAQRLKVGNPEAQHTDITYSALTVAPSDIEKAIVNLLRFHEAQTAIVFANTRAMVTRLTAKFSNRGFAVVSLSGELSQAERTNAMQALRDGRAQVCIATDVAARGIDLPGLDLVIHADLPQNAEALLHRSGRTGRAGRKGNSILIVPGRQRSKAQRLLKTAKLEAEWGTPPSADDVLAKDEERIISNPGLTEPLSDEELAFAQRLLEGKTPEQVAAAYLRLYREHHSAPEILDSAQDTRKPAEKDHAAFGPSTWFSLSLGRKDRAEPRWLLPMLCRNVGLSKSAIGAIRVQYQETFVEVANDAVPAMKRELGPELALEQGAKLTELAGVPDFNASPKGPPTAPFPRRDTGNDTGPRPDKAPKAARKPARVEQGGEAPSEPPRAKSKPAARPAKPPTGLDTPARDTASEARPKPKGGKPKRDPEAHAQLKPKGGKPKREGAPEARAKPKGGKPKHDTTPGARPKPKSGTAKPEAGAGDAARTKQVKGASDTSKSLRNRKDAHKPKGPGSKPPRFKAKTIKGGDAKPFRKPSRGS